MKKYRFIALSLIIGIVFTLSYCKRQISDTTEGWIDDSTFRILVTGKPKMTLLNESERKKSALKDAILRAQNQLKEKLKGSNSTVSPNVDSIIRKGHVIGEPRYDIESRCTIMYEIKSLGLRKEVNKP